MQKFYYATLLVFASLTTFAQKAIIKGQVTDTLASPLPSSTVMILSLKDSSLVNFGVTDAKGIFEIKNVNKGEYLLKITFVGFAPYLKRIATTVDPILDLGRIKMEYLTKELEGVVIMGEKNPVTVKKDTIEFNAGSFKTKTNATVEDLLKVMPGMEVQTDGTVSAHGEQVQRVTVDGREFFGRDPKLATRNLPADAIEKVQVFDRKSDQAQFTGIDDGQREKTINLELKEEKRKGAFGNLMGGYGSDNRFQATASVNQFSKGKQLSFLGMGNNINEQGFSIGDFMNFSGGTQAMLGGGGVNININSGSGNSSGPSVNFGGRQSGIMTNYAGGLNFNRDLNKDTKLTSSYFYNHLDRNVNTDLNRINFLPEDPSQPGVDKSNELNQLSKQFSKSDNHKGTLMLDHNIDSANTIKATANANYSVSNQRTSSVGETRNLSDSSLLNQSIRNTETDQEALSLNSSLLWRHRFEKKGRSISTNLTAGISTTDSDGDQQSTNKYQSTPGEQLVEQTNTQATNNQSYGATVSYTEPLGGRKYLEANYNFQTNRNDVDREVYDVGSGTPIFNTQLSNKYISNYIYNRPGLNFKINREKFSLTAGASYQMTSLKGDLISRDVKIDRTFQNLLPSTHFNYDFSSTKHLRIDYETSMQEPTIQQLQPVVDNSDPLNLYVGNPALQPAYAHRLNTNFTSFNPARFINFFAFINASYAKNAIVNSQSFANGQRLTMPVNVDYSKSLRANFNLGFPIKKLNSRFNFGPSATLSETIAVLDTQNNNARSRTLGGNSRYNFTYKEFLILDLSANLSQQETKYDFSTPDQQYFNQTYKAEINLSFLKKYSFNTSYEYLIYTSKTNDFSQEIPFLDISISRFILNNKAGELKFKVNNVLDQSNSVSQSSGENYIQQQTTNNLGRFYMVSFTYALNKHLNPMGGGNRRGGGGMRMIIQE
ncbi:MAG: TonB-dependent receptor [Flammeovirgaceae bacterium]|nr:TonB-dependent receptor [Flammeovirgaceae bacterium]